MADIKELLPKVKEMLVERLFLEVAAAEIGDDEDLIERFGIDSVRIFEVVVGLEENFGICLEDEEFSIDNFNTPAAIASVVLSKSS
jgi:acyl carrier protein